MTVLTAPRHAAFSQQMQLPFAPPNTPPTQGTHGTSCSGPLREPPRGLAKARSDKPGGAP